MFPIIPPKDLPSQNVPIEARKPIRMGRALLFGAILAHPLLWICAFAFGAAHGAGQFPMSAVGDQGPISVGWKGGCNALVSVFIGYAISAGIFAVMVSVIGAAIGACTSLLSRIPR